MGFNIADAVETVADAVGDKTALVSGDVRLTYAELDRRGNQVASFFRAHGVKAGDHVGVHLWNGHEFIEVMLGLLKIQAVPININYRYVADELRYVIENADLVAMVSQRTYGPMVREAATGLEQLKTVVFLDDGSGADTTSPGGWKSVGYAETHDAPDARDFAPRTGDELYIVYTGGTTGMPKGVMWRHDDLFYAFLQGGAPGGDPVESLEELASNAKEGWYAQTMLPTAPFIHGAGQFTAWICMFAGGKLVLQPGKSFDARRCLELVAEEQINTMLMVGDAMGRPLLDLVEGGHDFDLDSLAIVASSGAILSPSIKEGLEEKLDAMVLNQFGATEVGHQGGAAEGEESFESRPSFYMDESSTVLGDDLRPAKPGQIGKIARKGRIPLGYYKDEKKTAERFVTDPDGVRWAVPGDFALVEEDGRITVLGRGSNCINTGGEKVFPEEVEEALKAHPDVVDALVVGIPDPKWMQRVAAVVALRDGRAESTESLDAHCRKHLAGYKVPRQWTFAAEVARQPSGKPDYKWAKELALASADAPTSGGASGGPSTSTSGATP